MSKTLKIEDQTARKLYLTADKELKTILEESFGKSFFSLKITDRIGDWNDVLDILGINEDFLPYKNARTKEKKSLNAQAKLFKVAQVYNEGWTPNWTNSSEYKYFPYKYYFGGRWSVTDGDGDDGVSCASGLYFKTRELALDAMTKFESLYNDYLMIEG